MAKRRKKKEELQAAKYAIVPKTSKIEFFLIIASIFLLIYLFIAS